MIGNIEDAAKALSDYEHNFYDRVFSSDGTTRMVYLINDVIYKVDNAYSLRENRTEYENITALTGKQPNGVYFPETSLFEIDGRAVIAMELIEGQKIAECFCDDFSEPHTPTCMSESVYKLVSPIIDDTGGENVILTDDGRIYIIDAAC